MRFFEGILFLLSLLMALFFFKGTFTKSKKFIFFIPLTLLFFIVHWSIEGIRWQLYPLYFLFILLILALILNVIGIFNFQYIYMSKILRRFLKGLIILLLILSMTSAYVFPVYKMPKPNGKYKVGTITFNGVDTSRKEIYSTNKNENRKIRIQFWYPSDNVKGYKTVPWLEDGVAVANGISDMMGIPEFILSHTPLVKSNSYANAPISNNQGNYPIVIISHGWTGFRNLHTDVAEMLASNGYIVASIDHTYGAAVTVFNNNEVSYINKNALPAKINDSDLIKYGNTLVNTYAGDVKFTLNELEKLNSGDINPILKDKLDLSTIGLLGHSTGGGADVTTALKDNRVKALIGLDAWVQPIKDEDINLGLKIPTLFLRSEQWQDGKNNTHLYSLIKNNPDYKELYQINGMIHQDFTMLYMYSPLSKYLGITGKLDGWKCATIQHDFILSFFNKYLAKHSDADTININKVAEKYSEVNKIR